MIDLSVGLETERLKLQPVSLRHAEGLYSAVVTSRGELLPWMPWARDPTLDGNRLYTEKASTDWKEARAYHFALVGRETGLVLGVAGLNRGDASTFELHYWIRSDHAGRGLTTEACTALLDWAVHALGATTFTLWAGRANAPSRRVAEKLGFTDTGPLAWEPEGGFGTFPAHSYELSPSASRRSA